MPRLLFFIAIFCLVFWFIRQRNASKKIPRAPTDKSAEQIVSCHICQVHHPLSESFIHQGNNYCSNEHLQAGIKKSHD